MHDTSSGTAQSPIGARQRVGGKGRAVFYFYMSISIAFLMLEVLGSGVPRVVRAYANDLVYPALVLLEKPITASQQLFERLVGVSDIFLENETLRRQNNTLKQWQASALQLARENESLRKMLKVPERHIPEIATARIIGVGGGAFERSVILNSGSREGVKRNAPVINETGLVGRVIMVGYLSSRVLLISDLNSRVPVRLEASGALAIVEGQNDRLLKLTFINEDITPRVGEKLYTSGHGGAFPANIPIGKVLSVGEDAILVETAALLNRLDYLRILDYERLPPEAVRPNSLPESKEQEGEGS